VFQECRGDSPKKGQQEKTGRKDIKTLNIPANLSHSLSPPTPTAPSTLARSPWLLYPSRLKRVVLSDYSELIKKGDKKKRINEENTNIEGMKWDRGQRREEIGESPRLGRVNFEANLPASKTQRAL